MLDASGIIHLDDDLFLVAEDEIDILRYFKLDKLGRSFNAGKTIELGRHESDFESLAYDSASRRYYCIGSHGEDYSKRLLGFSLDGSGLSNVQAIAFNAQHLIDDRVNIEALSVWNSRLFIGYRRPSRNGRALAVLLDIDSGAQLLTSFSLAGRTFRDMVRIDDNSYLILAGPQKGKDYDRLPACILWWNGDIFSPEPVQCDVDLTGFRAEGIAVRVCDNGTLDVLIGSDESKIENAQGFRLVYINVPDVDGLIHGVSQPQEVRVVI